MVLFLLACHGEPPLKDESGSPEAPVCSGLDKPGALTEEGAQRGLTHPQGDPEDRFPGVGNILVEDLDADGDLDLVSGHAEGVPLLWENDGKGSFILHDSLYDFLPEGKKNVNGAALADLDGDSLPEVLVFSGTFVYEYPNLGSFQFGDGAMLYFHTGEEPPNLMTVTLADLDLDQDLDLVLPSIGTDPGSLGGPTRVLIQDPPGTWSVSHSLTDQGEGLNVQASLATDRDIDGDPDLLLFNDLSSRTTFWRNDGQRDGAVLLAEDADRVRLDVEMAGMGMDGADLNGDGRPDWCVSDSGPPRCFMSSGGEWFDAAQALGVVPEDWVSQWGTIGWSVELVDLDNDTDLDIVQASGELFLEQSAGQVYRDLIWESRDGLYWDRTAELEFGDLYNSVGMASADLDGDGAVELVLGQPRLAPVLYKNRCTEKSWIEVDPVGIGLNMLSIGARVEVEAGGQRQTREIYSLRSHGQGPSLLHFGLGDAEVVDEITVTWPGGGELVLEDVPARQRLVVEHP
jgi:enediyne biosynthesis protein E4